MTTFAVDIDSTLYDFASEVREAFFEKVFETGDRKYLKGAYSGFAEWRDLVDSLEDSGEVYDAIEWVHERQREQVPFKNSARIVNRLHDAGYNIKYVTGRLEKHHTNTSYWLQDYGFPKGELICTIEDKKPHIWDCQYLIDDRPSTLINFLTDYDWRKSEGDTRKAWGIWTPYNRNLTDLRHLYLAPTWRGIEFYLERKNIV